MKLISNYRDNELLRSSFIQLAADIFGLDFKNWHKKGYWGERYVPYSFAEGDRIVANVSVNRLEIIMDGKSYRGLQIGTVMTHPDYRNRGLSASLMNHILDEYSGKYDFMYLFANDNVLDFYPRFGFERMEESQYSVSFFSGDRGGKLRKLAIGDSNDLLLIEKMVYGREPVSRSFGTANSGGITMYHVLNVFADHLYYFEEEDSIVIFTKEEDKVHLYDVISKAPININMLLERITPKKTSEIVFHYAPDYEGLEYELSPFQREGALFVKKGAALAFPSSVKHPVTSEA
ncbi:GNAT family N-acetyltransferase [Mesobacillus subterraneus]|uniref:GNAT family N-acetyltransferase n=1 Tax=Mesobacillus subterraneus TaxID=285983 RepID=UPI00203FC085|nr:GNAT family N-acetyltransferase [Mesobacillus subterraneus]MCM3666792.1 GNAT family N-acetyltransferase [Mesobacillus subterraneus]MCM3685687.1 GNAT family N-acetyltransferase [Mesobacillus subterraneus]